MHGLKSMSQLRKGAVIVYGPTGRGANNKKVHGVALIDEDAELSLPIEELHHVMTNQYVESHLHADLRAILDNKKKFDAVKISAVFDLRTRNITWTSLEKHLEVKFPKQSQGYPWIGGQTVKTKLLELCKGEGSILRKRTD